MRSSQLEEAQLPRTAKSGGGLGSVGGGSRGDNRGGRGESSFGGGADAKRGITSPWRWSILILCRATSAQASGDVSATVTTTTTQASYDFYEIVGDGWCRPAGCDVSSSACRTNGFYKDNSSPDECFDTCEQHSACIGFAISAGSFALAPNRCSVYTSGGVAPAGWTTYEQPRYTVASANGNVGVLCYARLAQCDVVDGSMASTSYPCVCGNATCESNERCSSSSSTCESVCSGIQYRAATPGECPCTVSDHSGCDLPECFANMAVGEMCEADRALPAGQQYEVNNCPDGYDVFVLVCPSAEGSGTDDMASVNLYELLEAILISTLCLVVAVCFCCCGMNFVKKRRAAKKDEGKAYQDEGKASVEVPGVDVIRHDLEDLEDAATKTLSERLPIENEEPPVRPSARGGSSRPSARSGRAGSSAGGCHEQRHGPARPLEAPPP